jgi:hypothetical protein
LVCNGFPGAQQLLEELAIALGSITTGWRFRSYTKTHLSDVASDDLIAEIARDCDAALGGYGHCGSCTAGTVRDAVTLAQRDIPSVALVTEHFLGTAELVSRGCGMPDVPVVRLPYPLAQMTRDEMRVVAQDTAPAILSRLTQGQG